MNKIKKKNIKFPQLHLIQNVDVQKHRQQQQQPHQRVIVNNYEQQMYFNDIPSTTLRSSSVKQHQPQPQLSIYLDGTSKSHNNNKYFNNVTQLHAIVLSGQHRQNQHSSSTINTEYADFVIPQSDSSTTINNNDNNNHNLFNNKVSDF